MTWHVPTIFEIWIILWLCVVAPVTLWILCIANRKKGKSK